VNSASAASRSSTISAAITPGGGRLSVSSRRLVAQPEDVEADLVPGHQLVVGEPVEPLGLLALVPVLRVVAVDEVVEVVVGERVLLEREVLVGAQVVDPQLLRPRVSERACGRRTARWPSRPGRRRCRSAGAAGCGRRTRAAACGGPSPRLRPRTARCRARPPRAAVDLQQGLDVLDEVELLVRGGAQKSSRTTVRSLPLASPSALTICTDDFFPNGGLVSTMSNRGRRGRPAARRRP
jgi:hypothetical protein